jgi:magnesium chelatase family protein
LSPGAIACAGSLREFAIAVYCLERDAAWLLNSAIAEFGLSARAQDKILRVSRTIADLDASERITAVQLSEAISYRTLDRRYWA